MVIHVELYHDQLKRAHDSAGCRQMPSCISRMFIAHV